MSETGSNYAAARDRRRPMPHLCANNPFVTSAHFAADTFRRSIIESSSEDMVVLRGISFP